MAGAVLDIKYSGDRLVTCGEDGTIRVWDSWTGHCVRSITAHQRAVLSISLRQAPGLYSCYARYLFLDYKLFFLHINYYRIPMVFFRIVTSC